MIYKTGRQDLKRKWYVGESGVSWHVFQKNAHKTQESLISGMSDIPVQR